MFITEVRMEELKENSIHHMTIKICEEMKKASFYPEFYNNLQVFMHKIEETELSCYFPNVQIRIEHFYVGQYMMRGPSLIVFHLACPRLLLKT